MVLLVTAASVAGAVVADGQPTALPVVDAVLRGALAAAVTLASTQARRWTWATAAGIAVIGAHDDVACFVAGLAVFAVAVAATVLDVRSRVLGALVGGALVQVLLRLPEWGPTGTTALFAAVATMLLVVSGGQSLRRRARRRLVITAVVGGGVLLLFTAAFALSLFLARSDAEAGADAARAGIDAARAGETEVAIDHFEEAIERLGKARDRLDRPWSKVARIVPGIGQNEQALRRMVHHAAVLAETGAFAARSANVESLKPVNGRIDPAAITALEPPLRRVEATLDRTYRDLGDLDSPWLAWLVDRELRDLRADVREARHDTRTALLATEAAPTLLGVDQPRRYFVMFTTPTEARASGGGFMGNWGVLTAHDGRLNLTEFGRTSELNDNGDATRAVTGPPDYLARYARFGVDHEWRNVNMAPDFPTVAQVIAELFPQSGGVPIDGVMALDPRALARILRLTGPVEVPGLDEPLSADNAARFLLRDQYVGFPDTPDRVDVLEAAAEAVTERFTTSTLPAPRTIGRTLGPAVRNGSFRFVVFAGTGRRLLERLGTTGRFPTGPGDVFALVTQNASGSKIELFLHRDLTLDTEIDPSTGRQVTTATIRLRNDAPSSGLPGHVIGNLRGLPTGTSRLYVSLYSPLALAEATLDGAPITFGNEVEHGLNVYSTFVEIAPGATVTLEVRLDGALRLVQSDDEPVYVLDVWQQAMVNPDAVQVTVRAGDPWKLGDARHATAGRGARVVDVRDGAVNVSGPGRADRRVEVALER